RLYSAQRAASPETFVKDLSNFGWWCASQKFEERWSIEMLLAVLQITKKAQGQMRVVKLPAERCPTYPVECVACLRLMVEGDREGWLLLGVENDAQVVLKLALSSNNPEASLS